MTAPTCSAVTRHGARCQMPAVVGSTCYIHSAEYLAWHAARLEQRRRARRLSPLQGDNQGRDREGLQRVSNVVSRHTA